MSLNWGDESADVGLQQPIVGDVIEWVEFDSDAGHDVYFKTDVIEVNGHLWANGCGSVKTIADNFGFNIVSI